MLQAALQRWLARTPPALSAPPTHHQMRRLCRYHARRLRGLARDPLRAVDYRRRADAQAAWIDSVLRHHPLNDDLARTIRQSEALLQEPPEGRA